MAGYVYRGSDFTIPRLMQPDESRRAQCGTPSGRSAHRRRGEALCDRCRLAHNAYNRESSKKRTKAKRASA